MSEKRRKAHLTYALSSSPHTVTHAHTSTQTRALAHRNRNEMKNQPQITAHNQFIGTHENRRNLIFFLFSLGFCVEQRVVGMATRPENNKYFILFYFILFPQKKFFTKHSMRVIYGSNLLDLIYWLMLVVAVVVAIFLFRNCNY